MQQSKTLTTVVKNELKTLITITTTNTLTRFYTKNPQSHCWWIQWRSFEQNEIENLSFQKTAFYNGKCHCSRQQPQTLHLKRQSKDIKTISSIRCL